jgi:hypothetical protein
MVNHIHAVAMGALDEPEASLHSLSSNYLPLRRRHPCAAIRHGLRMLCLRNVISAMLDVHAVWSDNRYGKDVGHNSKIL